jgi:flagellar basal-body rod protein FlgB
MKIFKSNSLAMLKTSLDVYTRQHEAVAKNVAHAHDTDYKRVNTDFSQQLNLSMDRRLRTTQERHIPIPSPLDADAGRNLKSPEKIDLTKEMGELADNQIRFDFSSRTLQRLYRGLSMAITGRNN